MSSSALKIEINEILEKGNFDHGAAYIKQLYRFIAAVAKSPFLKKEEKDHWNVMGALLSLPQLKQAEQILITQNLNQLKTKQDLEKLKPAPGKNK